jgi:hypothetical protein
VAWQAQFGGSPAGWAQMRQYLLPEWMTESDAGR